MIENPSMLIDAIKCGGNKTALAGISFKITYNQLMQIVAVLEEKLKQLNIKKLDRVCFCLNEKVAEIALILACIKLGAIPSPIDNHLNEQSILSLVKSLECNCLFISDPVKLNSTLSALNNQWPEFLRLVGTINGTFEQIIQIMVERKLLTTKLSWPAQEGFFEAKENFAILHTSGTSGAYKGILLRVTSLINNASKVGKFLNVSENDICLLPLPLSYSYGLSSLLAHFLAHSTIFLIDSCYDLGALFHACSAYKVTTLPTTNFILNQVRDKSLLITQIANNLPHLKNILNAGGSIHPETIRQICFTLPSVSFVNCYGQTEAGPRLSMKSFNAASQLFSGIGYPITGVIFKCGSEHTIEGAPKCFELQYSSDDMMYGYYGTEKKVNNGSFIESGDLGFCDSEGNWVLLGRTDRMVKLYGRKVHLGIIEKIILELPEIRQVRVSVEGSGTFSGLIAEVMTVKNYTKNIQKEVFRHLKGKLNKFEIPKVIKNIAMHDVPSARGKDKS